MANLISLSSQTGNLPGSQPIRAHLRSTPCRPGQREPPSGPARLLQGSAVAQAVWGPGISASITAHLPVAWPGPLSSPTAPEIKDTPQTLLPIKALVAIQLLGNHRSHDSSLAQADYFSLISIIAAAILGRKYLHVWSHRTEHAT